jgi:lysozyme
MNKDLIKKTLERDEGRKSHIYRDSVGLPTIGVGRNLHGKGLSDLEIDLLLEHDILDAECSLRNIFGEAFFSFSDKRQAALISLMFMGEASFLTFQNLISAVKLGNWTEASSHLLASKYATQVGDRATRLAAMLTEG